MAMAMYDVITTVQAFFFFVRALSHNCTENRTKGFIGGLTFVLVRSIPFHAGSRFINYVADNSVRSVRSIRQIFTCR
jgi:hypothetical protein